MSVSSAVVSPLPGVPWSSSPASVRSLIKYSWFHLTKSPLAGSTVAVFGCGAIGLGVIATSELVKASRVIAVDTNPDKEEWARKFGATDFVNPAKLPEGTRIQDYLIEITDGGLDYTFDCTGNVSTYSSWGI